MGQPGAYLVYLRSFQQQFYRKIVYFSWIWTLIVKVEGEHADHLTHTTDQVGIVQSQSLNDISIIFFSTQMLNAWFRPCEKEENCLFLFFSLTI